MPQICLIAHNIRSAHNVGSLLRTAEGLGIQTVYLTGYTPYPLQTNDSRLPHLAQKLEKQISKTALGAQSSLAWHYAEDAVAVIDSLRIQGYDICALEQAKQATNLAKYQPTGKTALLIGNEVSGIEPKLLSYADYLLEIPMFGDKESFNVVQAAAMALYHLRFDDIIKAK